MGFFRNNETNGTWNTVINPNWLEADPVGYFTCLAVDLISGLWRTNLASGQGGT